jgi:histidinol phosphatase-like PHP family hydrolase
LRVDNSIIAEHLGRAAEQASEHLQRALKRAARAAFLWPVEAADLLNQGRSLTELPSIGPHLARLVGSWLEEPVVLEDIPPIRRHYLTLAKAREILADAPEWTTAYKGDLQMHSRWSDGSGTISEMADAAVARRYEYIAITDHSKGLKIADGITEMELEEQGREIDALNHRFENDYPRFRIFRSVELNLNPQGEGDIDTAVLDTLDLVVGSFHSKLREREDQTARYLRALRNPTVHILGHPVGRIYNHRIGLRADWHRVFATAAELDKAVEVDSYPDRQDLSIELLLIAKEEGVRVAIDTDAHCPEQLAFIELGLAAALLAGIPSGRIVNFLAAADLLQWVGHHRNLIESAA